MTLVPGSPEWLAQVREDILEPERRIVDPHHHLWNRSPTNIYKLDQLWADTQSGHKIEKTVFVQCRSFYRGDGPEHLKPVGETEAVLEMALESRKGAGKAIISGIISFADMTRGAAVEEVLDAHTEAGGGLFRGIRQVAANDQNADAIGIPNQLGPGLYSQPNFREGVKVLGSKGLLFEGYHFFHQNMEFAELAQALPDTRFVLDHFGSPLGVGPYEGKKKEVFETWSQSIRVLSKCQNVYAKLGGMAMPANGFGWDKAARPATSDEIVAAQRDYYLHTIDCFGPHRCMFETNYPIERASVSYPVIWNAFKKIAAAFSEAEKDRLFWGTAHEVYRL